MAKQDRGDAGTRCCPIPHAIASELEVRLPLPKLTNQSCSSLSTTPTVGGNWSPIFQTTLPRPVLSPAVFTAAFQSRDSFTGTVSGKTIPLGGVMMPLEIGRASCRERV